MGFTGGVSGGQDAVTTNYTGDRGMSLLVQDESYRHGSFLELVVIINIPKYYVVIITRVHKSPHKFMLPSYMKYFDKFLALLLHNTSFFHYYFIFQTS